MLLVGSFALYPFIGISFLPEEEDKYAMVTPETLKGFSSFINQTNSGEHKHQFVEIEQIRSSITKLKLDETTEEDLLSYLLVLERELLKLEPKSIIIQSILQDLHQLDDGRLDPLFIKLEHQIEM